MKNPTLLLFEPEKRCNACGRLLRISDFGKRSMSSDGLNASCRDCIRERKARYWAENREEGRRKHRERYWRDPAKARQQKHDDHAKHRDLRLRRLAWRLKQDEDFRRRTHEAKKRTNWRGLARLAQTTVEQLEAKITYWNDSCWVCGDPWEHIDHVKPILDKEKRLTPGGLNLLCNLRPACRRCNQAKNRYWPMVTTRRFKIPKLIAKQMLRSIDPNQPFDERAFVIMARRLSL